MDHETDSLNARYAFFGDEDKGGPPPHPLDDPPVARRLAGLQTLCLGVMVGLVGVTLGVWMVVWYALEGQPLAGHLVTVGGVPLATVVAGAAAILTPPVALWAGRARGTAGVAALAADPAAGDGPDGLVEVFAGVTFAEYAVAGCVAFACAAVFHFTSDPPMLLWVGGLVAFLAVRYPTTRRARAWFDQAADRLARERRTRTL